MENNQLPKLAWIGTGVMGLPMCGHLLKAGYKVNVSSRTISKAESLKSQGAVLFDSISEAVKEADIVFTMVGFPNDVEQVYFESILPFVRKDTILVDMTTTRPSLAEQIADQAGQNGLFTLDAPVSGGDVGARNATLSIMVGGDEPAFKKVLPLFECLGKQIVYQGPAGKGQHAKMSNQIVIASTMVGVCESLLYATRAGLDLSTMLESISGGAAGCWTLNNLAPRILNRNFDPGFFVDHFVKDMGIAMEESRRMNLQLDGLNLAFDLYKKTQEMGHGKAGTHALMLALEALAG